MRKQVVHTPRVPPARVPLSQAIKVGDWIFASGQLGLDVTTGKLAPGGIAAETRQVCENLKAVFEAAGSSLDNVVKVTIYMVDLGELMEMNDELRKLIMKNEDAQTITDAARRHGMRNLREDGWLKARRGMTTSDEVMRVTQEF